MTTSKGLGISTKYGDQDDHSREMESASTSMLSVSAITEGVPT